MTVFSALRHRNYRIYTSGSAASLIGTWMQRIATGWLAWELTGSGAWLGAVAFADLFPTVLIGPFAGAAADRWNRLTVTKISQTIAMCQALALCGLTASGLITIEWLLVLVAILGSAAAFNQPARLALIPSLVPRTDLTGAVALNSVIFNLARFIGPALAGLVIVSHGVTLAFAINAATFIIFLFALSRIRLSPPASTDKTDRHFLGELADGLRYTVRHRGIAAVLLLLIATSVGARPVVELLPAFAERVFGLGAEGLAILTSSIGVGAIIAGLWLGGRRTYTGLTRIVLASSLLLAVATILFAATDWLWAGIASLALAGFAMASTGISTQTLIQISTDSAMRGRVLSLFGLIFRGGPAIGALAMGAASDFIGLRWPVLCGACVLVATWVWAFCRRNEISGQLEGRPEKAG